MNPSIIIESEWANFGHLKVAQMCIIITILGHKFQNEFRYTLFGQSYLNEIGFLQQSLNLIG